MRAPNSTLANCAERHSFSGAAGTSILIFRTLRGRRFWMVGSHGPTRLIPASFPTLLSAKAFLPPGCEPTRERFQRATGRPAIHA